MAAADTSREGTSSAKTTRDATSLEGIDRLTLTTVARGIHVVGLLNTEAGADSVAAMTTAGDTEATLTSGTRGQIFQRKAAGDRFFSREELMMTGTKTGETCHTQGVTMLLV